MKLTVEISETRFDYEYEIGTSKEHGTRAVSLNTYISFCDLLRLCQKAFDSDHKEFMREATAKAYMEKHPREAKEFLKGLTEG